jgi:hypothetical protein
MKLSSYLLLAGFGFATASVTAIEQTLPPVLYASTVDAEEIYNKLKQAPSLVHLDKENVGNPVRLVITHKFEPTAGGTAAGLTSAILAGSSLGILPVVSNNDLVLTYEFRVHNEVIASFSYRENFTQAQNMYSNQGLYSLDDKALAWALTTTDSLISDMSSNQALQELSEEYHFYFTE